MRTDLTVTAAGIEYPVTISDRDGHFIVELGEHGQLRAASFAELQAAARKVKVKFELQFTQIVQDGVRRHDERTAVRHGTVTGIHAANGNLLVRWDNGKTEQAGRWGGGTYLARVTGGDEAELARLVAACNQAQRDLADFISPRELSSLSDAAAAARDRAAGIDRNPPGSGSGNQEES